MNFWKGEGRKWCCGGVAPEEREIDGSWLKNGARRQVRYLWKAEIELYKIG
jgi:hypothetical protein